MTPHFSSWVEFSVLPSSHFPSSFCSLLHYTFFGLLSYQCRPEISCPVHYTFIYSFCCLIFVEHFKTFFKSDITWIYCWLTFSFSPSFLPAGLIFLLIVFYHISVLKVCLLPYFQVLQNDTLVWGGCSPHWIYARVCSLGVFSVKPCYFRLLRQAQLPIE